MQSAWYVAQFQPHLNSVNRF